MPDWLALSVLGLLLVGYVLYLYLRYGGATREELTVPPGACCFCGKAEETRFFCGVCYRRLVLRYVAIIAGILFLPLGAAGGYVFHLATGYPAGNAVFGGIIACVLAYNLLIWTYIHIFLKDRVRWSFSIPFGVGFSLDPRGINVSPREEWWRFKLLLKQVRGATRITGRD